MWWIGLAGYNCCRENVTVCCYNSCLYTVSEMYGISHHDVMFTKDAVAAPPDDDSAKGGAQYISGRVRSDMISSSMTIIPTCWSSYRHVDHHTDMLIIILTCWSSYWHVDHHTDMLIIILTCWSSYWHVDHHTDMLIIILTCWSSYWHVDHHTDMLIIILTCWSSYCFFFRLLLSRRRIFYLHLALSSAPSSVISTTTVSFLIASRDLLLGRPTSLFPGSSILSILLPIYPSSFLPLMCSFLILSNLVTRSENRSTFNSAALLSFSQCHRLQHLHRTAHLQLCRSAVF